MKFRFVIILFSILLIFLSNLNFIGIKYVKIGVNEATYRLSAIISYPEKIEERDGIVIEEGLIV